jgi:predicted dehydrogenase
MSDFPFAKFEWPSFRPPFESYKTDYGIGIIGYGGAVRGHHMPAYRIAGYRIVAAADLNPDRQELARLDGVPNVYSDYRKLLERDDVQVIDCAVFHDAAGVKNRIQILKDAAKAGKPVLMQKPMAGDLSTAEEMVKIAEDAGISFAINQNMRFDPVIYASKQFLSPERFGKLGVMTMVNTGAMPPFLNMHFAFNSGGAAWGAAMQIHMLDAMRWLSGGEAVHVSRMDRNNSSVYYIEFSTGAVCNYMGYDVSENFHSETPLRIWAEKGALRGNHRWNPGARWEKDFLQVRGHDWPQEVDYVRYRLPDEANNGLIRVKPNYDHSSSIAGFIGVMGEFMQSLHEKRPALTNGRDNLNTLRLFFASELSVQNKQPFNPMTMEPV